MQSQSVKCLAVLAGLAATIPGTGLSLAVVLLGLLMVASRPLALHQALGVVAMQNGLVLTAITVDLSHARLAVVVLPWLPALALGALVLQEKITPVAILCAVLVILGVSLVLWPGRPRAMRLDDRRWRQASRDEDHSNTAARGK